MTMLLVLEVALNDMPSKHVIHQLANLLSLNSNSLHITQFEVAMRTYRHLLAIKGPARRNFDSFIGHAVEAKLPAMNRLPQLECTIPLDALSTKQISNLTDSLFYGVNGRMCRPRLKSFPDDVKHVAKLRLEQHKLFSVAIKTGIVRFTFNEKNAMYITGSSADNPFALFTLLLSKIIEKIPHWSLQEPACGSIHLAETTPALSVFFGPGKELVENGTPTLLSAAHHIMMRIHPELI